MLWISLNAKPEGNKPSKKGQGPTTTVYRLRGNDASRTDWLNVVSLDCRFFLSFPSELMIFLSDDLKK